MATLLLQLPPAVPATPGALRRSALSVQAHDEQQQQKAVKKDEAVAAPKVQTHAAKTYEEAVQASGLLKHKEPGKAGDGGRDAYVVQPMQLLSLYPRCAALEIDAR